MAERQHRPSSPPAGLRVERVDIRRLRLPLLESLDAAHGPTTGSHRELTVVALTGDSGVSGWGECAALATPGYWHETASSTFTTLAGLAAGLPGRRVLDLTDPSTVDGLDPAQRPMAAATLEMAALDLLLKVEDQSLADWLGCSRSVVPAGATVGLGPAAAVSERVAELATAGYRRVKVKIVPDTALTVVTAVTERLATMFGVDARGRLQGFELHVDGNGGYAGRTGDKGVASRAIDSRAIEGGAVDAAAVAALVGMARLGVQVIEQPFAPGDEVAAAALRSALIEADLTTLVMADEAATSIACARDVFAAGAADGMVVKPSRLGGLESARRAIANLAADGAAVAVGGMVESALGRHSLAAVAALEGVTVTGDLSPARRWLRDDPWPDVDTIEIDGVLHVVVPTGPGVAPPPDPDKIAAYTIEHQSTSR
ncbi:MAG: hypothetical protein OES24_04200 [Acidimicrobiia bacterium]|nr:hypothetical protein [Acidimicrobiia bacterium]